MGCHICSGKKILVHSSTFQVFLMEPNSNTCIKNEDAAQRSIACFSPLYLKDVFSSVFSSTEDSMWLYKLWNMQELEHLFITDLIAVSLKLVK